MMENEIKILGKYALDEVCVDSIDGSEKESFFTKESHEQVFPKSWDEVMDFGPDGYVAVKTKERWGIINAMGEQVIPCQWKEIRISDYMFPEGLCGVMDNHERWGFIDVKGEVVLPCQWKDCRDFRDGQCLVKDKDDSWSYIDTKGNIVRAFQWKDVGEWDAELRLMDVQDQNGLWGFVDEEEHLQIPCQWKEVYSFENVDDADGSPSVCWVMNQHDRWGAIDPRGRVVIPYMWLEPGSFSEGVCAVKGENGLWGAVDAQGTLVVPTKWDEFFLFDEGKAMVFKGDSYHDIDKQGKVIKDYNITRSEPEKTDRKGCALPVVVMMISLLFFLLSKTLG